MILPDTAALTARRDALQTRLRGQLLTGGDTFKLRSELTAVERCLAENADAAAMAAQQAQHADNAKLEAAAAATAQAIHSRLQSVLDDIAIPMEAQPMDDGQIAAAAEDLERATAALTAARDALAEAQANAKLLADRVIALETRRAGIIERRGLGDQKPGDAGEVGLILADLEGLRAMQPAATEPLAVAQRAVSSASEDRNRAATALSAAEDAALAHALHERLDELADLLATALARDNARLRRTRARPEWIMPPALTQALAMRNANRPDLAAPTWRFAAVHQPEPA